MEKKKANKILKSVAGVGVALGGASVFSEGDVVFAAEFEQMDVQNEENLIEAVNVSQTPEESLTAGSVSASASDETSQSDVTSASEAASESDLASQSQVKEDSTSASDSTVTSESAKSESASKASESTAASENAADSQSESASESTVDSESTKIADSESASVSLAEVSNSASAMESEKDSQTESASKVASESTSASVVASARECVSLSESQSAVEALYSESGSLVDASEMASTSLHYSQLESEAEKIYNSVNSEFEKNGYKDEYLEGLIAEIIEQQEKVKEALKKASEAGENVNHKPESNNYYGEADKLAVLLVKYKLYQEDRVKTIINGEFYSSGYDENNVRIDYIGSDNQQHTEYFDYVTARGDSTGRMKSMRRSGGGKPILRRTRMTSLILL